MAVGYLQIDHSRQNSHGENSHGENSHGVSGHGESGTASAAQTQPVLPSPALRDDPAAETDSLVRQIAYQIAYGLSHELNNPLANIAARARLLAEEESDPRKRQVLTAIVDQAMRGCEMIADLMHYARPSAAPSQSTNLNGLLDSLVTRATPWTSARGLKLEYQSFDQVTIECDRVAMQEALWAILRNAIEVARQRIEIRLVRKAGGTEVIIEDDGPGLTPPAQELAFHPYYSGRESGRGLGLGLSKAQRIIELSGGAIELCNRAGGGCQVTCCWT